MSSIFALARALTFGVATIPSVIPALHAQQPGAAASSKPAYVEEKLHSTVLNEERRVLVRLPRRYQLDAATRYPVLFKLDGDDGLKRYDDSVDVLSCLDVIPDIIVVVIANARGQRNRDMTPSSLHQEFDATGKMGTGEMGKGDRFLDFLEKELIPHVEQRYRTTAPRILAGHSRSALLVVQSLLIKPNLFQARFVFSAPLLRDERRLLADTNAFFAAHSDHRSFIYFNWGESENEGMAQSHQAMSQILRERAPKNLRWVVERARGANHQETPLMAIPAALSELFVDWSVTAGPDARNRTVRSSAPSR
jgi:predicted alpha/beta superfamily hydrolase